jgi:GAF domain-containing protein
MNVILQGDGTPYGVLEVDSQSEGEFAQNDIVFLQGVANILGMAIERQRMEGNLRQALDRQQLLIKEVNHRVNNSLSIVASMLHLHASGAESNEVRHELREASSRIAAIARAHQRLYKSDRIDTLDLGAYLTEVCKGSRRLHALLRGQCERRGGNRDSHGPGHSRRPSGQRAHHQRGQVCLPGR